MYKLNTIAISMLPLATKDSKCSVFPQNLFFSLKWSKTMSLKLSLTLYYCKFILFSIKIHFVVSATAASNIITATVI